MYKLSAVTKNYAKGRETVAALRGVDLVIEDGEWLAIQGPTGHGKSTLLQILGGLDRPSGGIVDFDGRDLAQLRETEVTRVRATSIGFVFQTFNLIPTLSAQENVEAALVPLHVSAAARQQRAAVALETVGLGDRLRHVPGELSGGRRADRQPGRGHQGRDHRLARGHVAGARPDHGAGHPRQHRGPPRPAHRRDEERPPEIQAVGRDTAGPGAGGPDPAGRGRVPGGLTR
jgi:ABC-type transport system involved in cytochrome c biogenesis ATPase subunit